MLHFPGPALARLQGQSLCLPQRTFLRQKETLVPPWSYHRFRTSSVRLLGDASPGLPRVSAHPARRSTDSPRPRLTFIQQTAFKMHSFPGAAITKSHIPGGLRQQTLHSPVLDARSPKSRRWQVPSMSCESIRSRPSPGFWQVASGAPRLTDGRLPAFTSSSLHFCAHRAPFLRTPVTLV